MPNPPLPDDRLHGVALFTQRYIEKEITVESVNRTDHSLRTEWKRCVLAPVKSALAFCLALRGEWRVSSENKRVLSKILGSQREIKLELGSGPKKGRDGWTTIDSEEGCDLVLNLIKPLPFPDNSACFQLLPQRLLETRRQHRNPVLVAFARTHRDQPALGAAVDRDQEWQRAHEVRRQTLQRLLLAQGLANQPEVRAFCEERALPSGVLGPVES